MRTKARIHLFSLLLMACIAARGQSAHPEPSVALAIEPLSAKLGDTVSLAVRLTNKSTKLVSFSFDKDLDLDAEMWDAAGGALRPSEHYDLMRGRGHNVQVQPDGTVRISTLTGRLRVVTIKPGESLNVRMGLGDLFDFRALGTYSIQVSWREPFTGTVVKSSVSRVEIVR